MSQGVFITFEGGEGAGKSTRLHSLHQSLIALRDQGRFSRTMNIWQTREPGAGELGKGIRTLVLGREMPVMTELLLMMADRSQHVDLFVRPRLDEGDVVLCDRYADSSVVYQGHGRGIPLEVIYDLNDVATGGLVPDLTFLLDVGPDVGLARAKDPNRMEALGRDFHERVRQGFLEEAGKDPAGFHVLDASQPEDVLDDLILARALTLIEERQT